ncbi:DUF1857-domain-containing protein [Sparassis latifolia]
MRALSVTLPVNSPSDSPTLTQAQVYAGLQVKARDATPFVAPIASCEVLREFPTGLVRRVQFKGDPEYKTEQVDFYPPSLMEFTLHESPAYVTNLISSSPEGDLYLTFTFATGPNGPLDESETALETEKTKRRQVAGVIQHTLDVIREMVRSGEIAK